MPQNRKAYIRFAIGLYVKEKKIQQQELAKEKASLSTEAKTLQQKIERLDNKKKGLEEVTRACPAKNTVPPQTLQCRCRETL
ncbi:hypothetical protein P5673_021965 [Acropora cervicornis]|uniref:Uncharacterized protein n=1 Tax=Acropora cervicornis TaxID=6130 RepID=A0AAD9Q8F7_ACRCE|nr:hypothetical protein P5673_021965 [Acropora cervicornis]